MITIAITPTLLARRELRPGNELVATTGEGHLMISSVYPGGSLDLVIPVEGHPALAVLMHRCLVALDDTTPGVRDEDGNETLVDVEVAPGVRLAAVIRWGATIDASSFSLMRHGTEVEPGGIVVGLPYAGAVIKICLVAVDALNKAEASAATKH